MVFIFEIAQISTLLPWNPFPHFNAISNQGGLEGLEGQSPPLSA